MLQMRYIKCTLGLSGSLPLGNLLPLKTSFHYVHIVVYSRGGHTATIKRSITSDEM